MQRLLASAAIAATLLIQGCAVHQAPYVTYSDRTVANRNTAVLVAHSFDAPDAPYKAIGITEVDAASTSCFNACPVWVRVLPGTHTFQIRYSDNFQMGGGINFQTATIPLTVDDMKPGHTYRVSYTRLATSVRAHVEDLGPNANFGMRICGMYGDCKSIYRATFD